MRRTLKYILLSIPALSLLVVILIWAGLRLSLPQLDGDLQVAGLTEPVSIHRDTLGVVTIETPDRFAAAYATGFAHAQDRFFQMDLARRFAAGELAELFGSRGVDFDSRQRRHQLRKRARQSIANVSGNYLKILESYVAGVNGGLESLNARPFEYSLIGTQPQAWLLEDSVLVLSSMYFRLQSAAARRETRLGWLAECFAEPVLDFLAPVGTRWDAPLTGEPWPQVPVPSAEQLNIRELPALELSAIEQSAALSKEDLIPGSNNWALSGQRSATGAALVANDMHLGLGVPHIWYRLRLLTKALDGSPIDVSGISLPGMPFVVVGSNTNIAWGFTNSYGDWLDLVQLELDTDDHSRYLTPTGSEAFDVELETIQVKGEAAVEIEVRHSRWGPIIDEPATDDLITSATGQKIFAWRWIAHRSELFTAPGLLPLEYAKDITDAIELAPLASIPAQNLVVGDRAGNIGWTIMGQIPLRNNSYASRFPLDWRSAAVDWPGWLATNDYPVIINPGSGQLWTANNRQADGQPMQNIGYGQVALGARARQIRDDLTGLSRPATVDDMHAVHLDDRALFLDHWRELLLQTLDQQNMADGSVRAEIYRLVSQDSNNAAVDAVGYRLVREFRQRVKNQLMQSLTRQCSSNERAFSGTRQAEGPVWEILQTRPMHLLDAAYPDWQTFLLTQIDALVSSGEKLEKRTWGAYNRLDMTHPVAGGIPIIGQWLNMRSEPLAGDNDMPRVQRTDFGQSQRMAVSPGFEAQGYMVMPGGQSGHPLSPFYRSLHKDWVVGNQTPFLPGETSHSLNLNPNE